MFVTVNQTQYNDSSGTRIFLLEIRDGKLISKRKFRKPVNYECGSVCSPTPDKDYGFQDERTFYYRRHEAMEEAPRQLETIKF